MDVTYGTGTASGSATDGKEMRRRNRRTALLRRLLSGDTKGATIRRATTMEDLYAAYKVTHDTFVAEGYIEPDPTGIRLRPCEALPQSATFIAELYGRIVGVTTVVIDSDPIGVPSDKAFKPEIDELRRQGRRVTEGTNWLVLPEVRNSGLFGELFRAGTAFAIMEGCDDILGSVSPGHAGFYESVGYEVIGSERSYSDTHDDPVVLVRLDLDLQKSLQGETRDFLMSYWWADNPYRDRIPEWTARAEAEFRKPELLCELFVTEGQLLQRCDPMDLEAIRRAWGQGLFEQVMALAEGSARRSRQPLCRI